MSNRYIEKAFLYLLALSVLLHVALFAVILLAPEKKTVAKQEPVMVELQDLPPVSQPSARDERAVRRQSDQFRRVPRETAPKGERERDRVAAPPSRSAPAQPFPPRQAPGRERGESRPAGKGEVPVKESPRGVDIFKPRAQPGPDIARLMPSADKMARLEESYRKKYGPEVAEGETRFLNTDDIMFGSFLRRFETAVYGVWRYPQEAAQLGIEGVTPVRITFNRQGEIEKVEILESSGSRILDNEVLRTLRMVGPIGGFPRGYDKDQFNLIAFFQYGITRGGRRGTLR
ncbi:energy transducer TonB [Geomobilimonas luticola]|uniref:TonB family protein n=1 Tax=Geomobilimonas luticola TaxID=1114878 RepID=A0ABS5SGQ1_9BACT|nr:energy transducer TonB [Geomobilimonas luticola]MBT0654540.1 TonB family protein [Geomobilimonas luticola]